MLLENAESRQIPEDFVPPSHTADPTPAVVGHNLGETIRGDVEHLIHIAGQLFSAIERQIHAIEIELTTTQIDERSLKSATVFKEHLIRSATNLNSSLQEIAHHLGEMATGSNEQSRGGRASFGD
jgi:hypothetical protein